MNNSLEKFGQIFIEEVRDYTIRTYKKIFDGSMKGLTAQEVRERISTLDEQQKNMVLWLISKVVDDSMHNMLLMLEEHEEIEITYEKINIVEESDGLTGELYTEDGWIEKYSKQ